MCPRGARGVGCCVRGGSCGVAQDAQVRHAHPHSALPLAPIRPARTCTRGPTMHCKPTSLMLRRIAGGAPHLGYGQHATRGVYGLASRLRGVCGPHGSLWQLCAGGCAHSAPHSPPLALSPALPEEQQHALPLVPHLRVVVHVASWPHRAQLLEVGSGRRPCDPARHLAHGSAKQLCSCLHERRRHDVVQAQDHAHDLHGRSERVRVALQHIADRLADLTRLLGRAARRPRGRRSARHGQTVSTAVPAVPE